MPDWQENYVDGAQHRIAYRRAGQGPPLALLHPLALSGAVWGGFADALAADFDVIAVDARGCGSSGWDGEPFGVDDLAADVLAVLDALDLQSCSLVGLSMGGSTAIALAGRHPQRIRRLALADTTAWYGDDAVQSWTKRAGDVLERPRPSLVPFQVDRWFAESFRARRPDEVNRVVRVFLQTDSLAHAAACHALGVMDSRPLLSTITAPTLVLTGEHDYATPPPMGQAVADGVVDGQARVLDGLRHLSLVEDVGLAAEIREFLLRESA